MPKPKLFLLDAHALSYRSFYAIKGLTTSYGQATGAVYGFISTLKKILRDFKPEYMAVCFDVGKKTRRQERFAEYKVHRPPMPDDLISQIPLIKEAVGVFNLPTFELEGFEADDVIATITAKVPKEKFDIVIVSGDKDMVQLLENHVKMYNVQKEILIDYEEAKKLFGIEPSRITDYLGLAGDSTDNIPGVHGIGEVTARDLVNEFGTIENIYKNIEHVKSEKLREKLASQKEQAAFSKELATLDANVPLDFDLDKLKVIQPDSKKLFEFFKRLEFRKLADELAQDFKQGAAAAVRPLKNNKDIEELIKTIQDNGSFVFDFEVVDETQMFTEQGLMVAVDENQIYSIPSEKVSQLKTIFENTKIIKITHDAKEQMKAITRNNLAIRGRIFDVMLAAYLASPSQGAYDVLSLAWNYLKSSVTEGEGQAKRVECIIKLFPILEKELKEKSLLKLFEEIEIPLAYVLFRMETFGVTIDEALLKELSNETQKKSDALVKQIYDLAGMEFNLNSPKQLSHVLFEKLSLPVVKKTKTGFSTDEGVLVRLSTQHALPALILEYRQITKLKSTYIDALPKLISTKTNRLHACFNQTGTETGRLSSNNPNLQNIPIRTELGRQIRKAFIPSAKDRVIISADYSQIELRILAHLSGDKNLSQAFKEDQDIHRSTAAQIFDVKEKDVTGAMRDSAKRVNFGIIYGISPFGLAKDLEISQADAQQFIERYFVKYPLVKEFMDGQIKLCEKDGFITTLLSRRRYLPEIKSSNMAVRQFAQRQAINTPVQGSAADLIKLAMINIQKKLEEKSFQSKMIITVHDELVFDVAGKETDDMIQLIRREMEHSIELSVPVKVSVSVGKNWLETIDV